MSVAPSVRLRCFVCSFIMSVCSYARCKVCQKQRQINAHWTALQIKHSKDQKSPLVCRGCKENGYTEKDLGTHKCKACGDYKARGKYNQTVFNNALKSPDRILVCLECGEREKALLSKLTVTKGLTKPYLCTCRCPLHTEKCAVYRRWPGVNVGITMEDLRFLKLRPSTQHNVVGAFTCLLQNWGRN